MGRRPKSYGIKRTKRLSVGRVTAGVKVTPRKRKLTAYARYDAP